MRTRFRYPVALLFAALFVLALAVPASAQTYTTVVVQPGDTLSKIAARNCTSWQTIYNINQATIGPNPSVVEPGMVLTVPNNCGGGSGGGTGGVVDNGPRVHATGTFRAPYYTVAWGDTLTSIGLRFNSTVNALRSANGISGNVITPGQILLIPGAGGPVSPPPTGGGGWSGAERISFNPGAIAASRTGTIALGAPKSYVIAARAGQSMEIWTNSHGEALFISVVAAAGAQVGLGGTNGAVSNYVFGTLPATSDYLITVSPTTAPESPTLTFDITVGIR